MKKKIVRTISGMGLLLIVGLLSIPAEAGHLICGSTVSGHVVFDGDLNCYASSGLTVGADNTTIDLAGFKLTCTGAGFLGSCQTTNGPVGINTAGFNNVLIKGSTIDGFQVGVHVNGGSNINVKGLTVTGPPSLGVGFNNRPFGATGIMVTGTVCPDPPDTIVVLLDNDVSNHLEGIKLVGASCVNVRRNVVHDNDSDPFECHGILLINSGTNNIGKNLVFANGENLFRDGGLTLTGGGTTGNTVERNDASNNCGDGISARFLATGNKIVNNVARGNPTTLPKCGLPPGFFADLAEIAAGPNKWNKNNRCNTQAGIVPAGVCKPGE